MSIANFFDKVSLGASQLLHNYNREKFEEVLLSHSILVSFDQNAADTTEGKATLDLLTRLLSRLYPRIQFEGPGDLKEALERLALAVNPVLDIANASPTVNIVIGETETNNTCPTLYLGSAEWDCKFSRTKAVGSKNSGNPFGAGAAACVGAANLFRMVFKEQLPHSDIDSDFELSLLNLELAPTAESQHIVDLDLGSIHLIGLGAIGNAVLWSLKNINCLKAEIIGIEPEKITLSNLQRYVLTDQSSEGLYKIALAERYISGSSLTLNPFTGKWSEYIHKSGNYSFDKVAICVDNRDDRIFAQASLPKKIFNAWTQHENLGVSRHLDFGSSPCLCCLYMNSLKGKSRAQEIADNLNLSAQELMIRRYLANSYPVDMPLLQAIKGANNLVDSTELDKFIGQPLDVFYSEAVCGGLLLNLIGNEDGQKQNNIEVPCAFESAMAGILLAAELVKDRLGYSLKQPASSARFNLLRSIGRYIIFPESVNENCICTDNDYIEVYKAKWYIEEPASNI